MAYWGNPEVLRKSNLSYYTPYLIENGDGRCGAWARLFVDVIRAQGYDLGEDVFIRAKRYESGFDESFRKLFPNEKIPQDYRSVFFVNNWVSNPENPHLIKEADGVAGQLHGNPISDFSDHGIVSIGNNDFSNLYDPSYGTGPFGNVEDWAKRSLAGVGLELRKPLPFVGNPPVNCDPDFWLQTPTVSGNDFMSGYKIYDQLENGYDNFGK